MKKILFLALIPFLSLTSYKMETKSMTLKEALAQKLISVTTKSTGNYSGGSVSIAFKSNSRKDLKIIVPAGSLFDTDNDDEQDMIVVDEQKFFVKANSSPTKILDGYCCQHSNQAPSEGSGFKPTVTKNEKLMQLAKYVSTNKNIPDDVKQDAVWAVSDNSSVASIYHSENEDAVKALRKKVCEITGQKDVWYNSKNNTRLDANRNIVREPVSIEGKLLAKIDKAGEIWYEVYDSEGNKTSRNNGKGKMPSAGEYNLTFRLTVEGWKKGNYTVKLMFEGNSIYEAPFEVG